MTDFWNILRILTTNSCNYRCLYCHNEGQEKAQNREMLSFDDFLSIAKMIEGLGFKEIRFSGGEPLLNPDTIKMIEWLDQNSDYEIGLATNGSLITEEIAKRLSNTRVLITMHLPAIDAAEYRRITGQSNSTLFDNIKTLERYEIQHSFNFVLYPETINNIMDVLNYSISNGKRVKLLPYIEPGFNNYSSEIIDGVHIKLDDLAIDKKIDDKSGIITWAFSTGGKVKLLCSPCYDHNIARCKQYGELRLLPDLSIQKCIFESSSVSLKALSPEEQRETITNFWESFNKCN